MFKQLPVKILQCTQADGTLYGKYGFFLFPYVIVHLCFLTACNFSPSAAEPASIDLARNDFIEEIPEVRLTAAETGPFRREIVANGKLEAYREAELTFKLSEDILRVAVRNGARVRVGDTMAVLDNRTKRAKLLQAGLDLEKARTEMQDVLIGYGYSAEDSARVPESLLRTARAKSGYNQALAARELARLEYAQTAILAPFSGIVAQLEAQAFNAASNYKTFCTLIDDSRFWVSFSVLESELSDVKSGRQVEIIPLANEDKRYRAQVSEINPLVDPNGLVQVKALLVQSGKELYTGMNVRVALAYPIPNQLIIPKAAVVKRQGRDVVFTCVNDTVLWNYVELAYENSAQYAVKEGLKPGDKVVVDGNLNLAHKVRVKSQLADK